MDSIILPANLSVSDIKYGTPRTLESGGKAIYLSFNKSPIVLQTPQMWAPFGKSKWLNDNDKNKGTSAPKFTLDLSFKGMESSPVIETFYNKMTELDNKLIEDGVTNSFDWLKKKGVSKEVISNLYTKLVRHHSDKDTGELTNKYPPTFKLNLPFKDDKFTCEVYDANKQLVDLNTIETKGCRVTAIIQCLGIWVAAGKFGCTWKVLQMRVVPPQTIKGYAFKEIENDKVDDDVDDDEEKDDDVDPDEFLHHSHIDTKKDNNEDDEDDDVVESSDDDLEVKKPEQVKPVSVKKTTQKKK
jgi:hypothetical protein